MTDQAPTSSAYYHEQSQRIRRLAADAHSAETRDQFLALAEQYERLGQGTHRASSPRTNRESHG